MPTERRLAAIMFTDIVGYTALMARDEEAGRRARDRHEAVVRPLVERYGGEWIERTGDETLSAFPSALDAVNCALAAQAEIDGDSELQLRIGVHHGDVTFDEHGVSGDGVNVAARVRPLASPGGICVTGDVHHSIQGRTGLAFEPLGEQDFKNVGHPVPVFAVSGSAEPPSPVRRARSSMGIWPIAALVLIAISAGWWVYRSAGELAPIRSIAVLPLENLSGDPGQEYFADGMTEALIAELARIRSLKVISRTSVMPYKTARKPLREIAGELDVQGIVEGSVLRAGDRVRVTLQLIDARSDHHVWAESYQRELSDVLALQGEIAGTVARQVAATVTAEERTRQRDARAVDARALDAYLRGIQHIARDTPEDLTAAIASFEEATGIDPGYAQAYGKLSRVYARRMWGFGAPHEEWMPGAERAARRALELDETVGSARTTLATITWVRDYDWTTTESELLRAVELDPGDPESLDLLSWYYSAVGRHRDAIEIEERLLAVAPLDPVWRAFYGGRLFYAGESERAVEEYLRVLADHPTGPGNVHWELGNVYAQLGRTLERWIALQRTLERPSNAVAWVCGFLGNLDCAFDSLERSFREHDSVILGLGTDPKLAPLRSDPRYHDLLRRINYPGAS